jgi:hypothetical protein
MSRNKKRQKFHCSCKWTFKEPVRPCLLVRTEIDGQCSAKQEFGHAVVRSCCCRDAAEPEADAIKPGLEPGANPTKSYQIYNYNASVVGGRLERFSNKRKIFLFSKRTT